MKVKAEKTDENRSKRNVGPLEANPFLVNTNVRFEVIHM
jgi:hypothetical protein